MLSRLAKKLPVMLERTEDHNIETLECMCGMGWVRDNEAVELNSEFQELEPAVGCMSVDH